MFDEKYLLSTSQLLHESDIGKKTLSELKDKVKNKKADGSLVKRTIVKMYQTDIDSLASELPTVGEIIRLTILVGIPTAINPILGIFTLIADRTIKDNVNVKVIDKYIRNYEKQIAKSEKEIEKCKDPTKKKYLKEHHNDLKNGLSNLENKKYDLEDKDVGGIHSALSTTNDEQLNDSMNLLEHEYSLLSEEQKLILFDDSDIYLNEAFDKTKQKVRNVKHVVNGKIEKMDGWFNKTLKDIRFGITNSAKEDIIEQNVPKMSKMVKRAMVLGTAWAINPAMAAIGAVTAWTLSKKGKETQRQRILRDLNNELEMVEEKIKDADANSDKNKKYELMRLRQSIQNNRDKIKRTIVV